MTSPQALFWVGCLCLIAVLAEKKEHSGKISHENSSKGNKHHHLLGHWGEHWSMVGKPTSKHEGKDVMKHAPSFVSHHEANMQSDLGYKKNSHDNKHKPVADLHLQDLLMEESQRHETREQKITKVRPNHSIHHRQDSHQIPKPHPTNMAALHLNPHNRMEHHDYFHHKPTASSLGHKSTKITQKKMKPKKTHSKEKKPNKKFPKKFNQRKHEKKMLKLKN